MEWATQATSVYSNDRVKEKKKLRKNELTRSESRESLSNQMYHLKILKSSSISESPGNNGLWVTISANIQPTDHTSTGVE